MIVPMLSGGSTLSMVLVILVMTSMAGNIFSHVTTLKSCLDSFRNKRSDEYSFNHLFQRDYCNNILNLAQFVKVTKPEIGPDGYTEVALDYLDNNDDKLRSGIMEKIVKQLDAPCVPLLSMIILQLEKVNTLTRESKLRKKVNELGDSLQLIELDDDYYPYCQLMTFTQSYGFIQWFMRKLKYKDDDIILANDHRGLLGTEAPFRELFDKLVPAYFSLKRKQLRLVRIFSDAVRPVRTKLGDEYVLESFQLGFRPLLDFKGFNRGWYWKQSNPVEVRSSLGSKFGLQATKESIPKIIRLVGHRFLPACRAFLKAFKDVFDEEYMRKNATRFKHAVWQYGHTWGLLGLIHIWGIYHDCYFLVNDRDGAFIDMLRREGDEKKANQEGDNSSSFAAGKLEQNSSENE